jgi:preprotein translocase subunit SecG
MYSFISILIIIACILLMLVVLIQNPKGGGLSSTFGGLSNQILGVKRTTDFLEKATWTLIIAVALLSMSTAFLVDKNSRHHRS